MDKNFYLQLGKKIKYYREQKGFTQQQLADKINKGLNFTGKIEVGFSKPSLDTLIDIANALEISVSELAKFN